MISGFMDISTSYDDIDDNSSDNKRVGSDISSVGLVLCKKHT